MTRNDFAKRVAALAGVAAAGLSLAACGGSSHNTPAPVTVTPPPASLESKFGANFATDYDASNNSTPPHPSSGDINAVDPTAQPIPLHS